MIRRVDDPPTIADSSDSLRTRFVGTCRGIPLGGRTTEDTHGLQLDEGLAIRGRNEFFAGYEEARDRVQPVAGGQRSDLLSLRGQTEEQPNVRRRDDGEKMPTFVPRLPSNAR